MAVVHKKKNHDRYKIPPGRAILEYDTSFHLSTLKNDGVKTGTVDSLEKFLYIKGP